jgi:hypothetical protein
MRAAVERLTKRQAAETRAHNDDVRMLDFHPGNRMLALRTKANSPR